MFVSREEIAMALRILCVLLTFCIIIFNASQKNMLQSSEAYQSNTLVSQSSIVDKKNIIALASISLMKPQLSPMSGIPIVGSPVQLFVDPLTNMIYAATSYSNSISIINGSNDQVTNKIKTLHSPSALAFNAKNRWLYLVFQHNNTVYVINTLTNQNVTSFPVGSHPHGIIISPNGDFLFIPNYDAVSVVHAAEDNTDLGEISMNTYPVDIALDPSNDTLLYMSDGAYVYAFQWFYDTSLHYKVVNYIRLKNSMQNATDLPMVINSNNKMMYVLDTTDDKVLVIDKNFKQTGNISVGDSPSAITINPNTNMIYVANSGSDTVSVIDGRSNKWLRDIVVGRDPKDLAFNPNTNMIYVANSGSDTVSVIDGRTNNMQTTARFIVNPINSGHIICDGKDVATNTFVRIKLGAQCKVEAYGGYVFSSMAKTLNDNSSKTIPMKSSNNSVLIPFINLFYNTNLDSPFKVDQSGTFTANFRVIMEPIPEQYLLPLYGIIPSFFIPYIINWLNGIRQRKHFHKYVQQIKALDIKIKNKDDDKCLKDLKENVLDSYTKGQLSDSQYDNLNDDISKYEDKTQNRSKSSFALP